MTDLNEQFESDLKEAFGWFNNIKPFGNLFGGFDNVGNFWNTIQYAGGTPASANFLLFIFQSPFYNRLQRWMGRYLCKISPIAIASRDNLINLIIGYGFKYVAKNKSQQARLDAFLKNNKYIQRSRESFGKMIEDGESFQRLFDDKVRFIEPDLIYSKSGDDPYSNGIITNPPL